MKTINLIFVLLSLGVNQVAEAQNEQPAEQVARNAISDYTKSINQDNFTQFGFKSLQEGQKLSVSEPITSFFIRLDALKNYRSGQNVSSLLKIQERQIFMVTSNGETPWGTIELERVNKIWQVRSIGASTIIEESFLNSKKYPDKSVALFLIPALNRNILGVLEDKQWLMIPLGSSISEFQQGQPVLFERLLPTLQREANEYNGLPR